jgi:enoyl-CoA hydratase/carnithine racemase
MPQAQVDKHRARLEDYANQYEFIRMRREDGILEVTLHTEGAALRWRRPVHIELEEAFLNIGRDPANHVVILTGTGEEFSGPLPEPEAHKAAAKKTLPEAVELSWEVQALLRNLLEIDVPMISCVNGPAKRHAELPLLCDIVLAAEHASFQDSGHFVMGLVPGDGMHAIMPMLLGINRARYFLLTGQIIGADEAKRIGVVSEVLPANALLPRAWELARDINQQPEWVRRYTRRLLTEKLRREIAELGPYGWALQVQGMTAGYSC